MLTGEGLAAQLHFFAVGVLPQLASAHMFMQDKSIKHTFLSRMV